MCCIFLSISHPIYQFILISNRDEFLKRSTRSSQWHSFPTPTQILQSQQSPSSSPSSLSLSLSSSNRNRILSGIDSDTSGGGTWLGITSSGKFGALTNFTEIKPPPLPQDRGLENYRSRGGLVKDWLIEQIDEKKPDESKVEAKDYLEKVSNQSDEYPGFNLLIGELARNLEEEVKIGYLSNREEKVKNQKGDGRNDVTFPSAKRLDLNQGGRVYSIPSTDTKIENQINRDKMNQTRQIETGCESCGLSNSVLDDRWEKVNQGNLDFEKVLQDHLDIQGKGFEEDKMIEELFGILG